MSGAAGGVVCTGVDSAGQSPVGGPAAIQLDLGLAAQLTGALRLAEGEHAETVLARHRFGQGPARTAGIELKWILAPLGAAGVVAVEKPAARIHRRFLVLHSLGHVDAVGDAVGVGQDQGGPGIALGFQKRPHGVLIAGTHGHAGHIDGAVGHRHQAQVFLRGGLAGGGEFCHGRPGRGLRHLAAGVGVHLRIEHQGVDIPAAGQHVIEATKADVVGPAIPAHQPDTLLHQGIGQLQQPGGPGAGVGDLRQGLEQAFQIGHPVPLGKDPGLIALIRAGDRLHQGRRQERRRIESAETSPLQRRHRQIC